MSKRITWKGGLGSVLLWSVISAAFIGPGTVTTAANAGALFGTQLLWALLFSTLATILLQEGVVRLTLVSGKSFGEVIRIKFGSGKSKWIPVLVFFALWLGCSAYEAGNIVGAAAGIKLFSDLPQWTIVLFIGSTVFLLLSVNNPVVLARILGLIVAIMGMVFCWIAFKVPLDYSLVLKHSFLPSLPTSSALLVIGLIGTTIVPYSLFLASGVTKDQEISEMRWGITIAILFGGIISMAILLVGTQISGTFSFEAIAYFFAIGLFAAGFSSAITAPMAAGLAGTKLLDNKISAKYIWLSVLLIGLAFGLPDIKPIPLIIFAQALNGLLLPLMTTLLYFLLNDPSLMGTRWINNKLNNALFILVVAITCWIGLYNVTQAYLKIFDSPSNFSNLHSMGISLFTIIYIVWVIFKTGK
ncbi:MAG: divalent metal cation transporter [Saprospiraceae bacterium]|nr:divalent metal cation transporter [Saprospiraceae bacterium]